MIPDPFDGGQPPPPPWDPSTRSFGYLQRGAPVPCTREDLVRICEQESIPHRVWTPESHGLTAPEEVPFLMAAIRRRLVRSARGRTIAFALVGLLVVGNEASRTGLAFGSPAALYAAMALALVGFTLHAWYRAARLTPDGLRTMLREAEQSARVRRRPVVHTRWLIGMMAVGGAAQLLAMQTGASEFGAIPAAVWSEAVLADGEWWRVLTAAFVHGGTLHFAVNLMALIALGRETEMFAGKGLLPLVFLLAALGGSVLGVVMPPDVPSVGSSGGLVGVIAFQGILAWRRPHQVPPGFLNTALINVALLVGIGLVGYAYVDNAAHAGGFLVGGAVGLLVVPSRKARPEWEPGKAIETAGNVSLAILAAACLWTAFLVITQAA